MNATMSVDVDAVNERLNGLVTLLKAVGVDAMSNEKGGTASKKGGLPDARQLDDAQIEAIIKKLQMAQSEAPQIIAALEAQAASKKRQQQSQRQPQQQQQHHHHHSNRHPQEPPEQKHVEEEEEDSDEDSFDEDANYPMVGHGCSDDVSIMSDLTTPTVLVGVPVPEEEHYRDSLPPMIVGGGGRGDAPPMLIAPTKRKNLVGAVKPAGGAAAMRRIKPTGGAAAQRRKNYNATMEKLAHEGTPSSSATPKSKTRPTEGKPASSKSHKVSSSSSSSRPQAGATSAERGERSSTLKKSSKSGRRASMGGGNVADWDEPVQAQEKWSAFESSAATKLGMKKASTQSSPPPSTLIDDDGFLMNQAMGPSFDPFDEVAFNPFQEEKPKKSSSSSSRKSSTGKAPKPTSSNASSGGNSHGNGSTGGSATGSASGSASGKQRRSRRASCL